MKLEQVNKTFGSHQVLKNISLDFPRGKVTVLVGPSGSGKSTILRSLNILEKPETGTYDFDDLQIDFSKEISKNDLFYIRQKTGMVFQSYNLFPHFTVLENIIEGPIQVLKKKRPFAIKQAKELLIKVGLSDKANAYPEQLSGGQAQRVAIARSLAMNPEYILLDEPTSALDPELELEVLKVLLQIAKEQQSMVIVTHNLAFAKRVADKIIFVEEGNIIYDGSVENFFDPDTRNARISQFISSMTFEN
ncbi:amino acid ABC transporter ATP-binding protein [Ligilactobacillus sp. WILCCON 0076]|uniref:Amino acid ABC transporter ATP-binding protein n=1 Tax=Ligilactobacillus ubinensis TaxID=2876789 RepID=A0A9X2FKY7_9LACO|nr:amino acid ABC transporter ATP-binding protein [Ligilactobacillus ubinensis]MCP0887584.1 amino acid ABC transporter ATP-binding protein [Ligilactobacillus ubinensis]